MNIERTFAFLKPDAVMRGLIGEIVSRIENKGLNLAAAKLVVPTRQQAEQLYEIHRGKQFYDLLVSHITSGPIFAMVIEGPDSVTIVRKLVGATNPVEAAPGSIRGDYAATITPNAIHASDSPENAKREMTIFFGEEEIVTYLKPTEQRYLWKD